MAGTNKKQNFFFSNPAIILRSPQLPENIGMVARSMFNYGFNDLRIVSPKKEWPNKKANSASAGALDIISNDTKVYNSLKKSFQGIDILFATSIRNRDIEKIVLTPREAVLKINKSYKSAKIGFLFGPEQAGLNNNDLSEANYIIQIPTNPSFGSLNLAMAVNIICYEWFLINKEKIINKNNNFDLASKDNIKHFKDFLIKSMYEVGFFKKKKLDKKLEINLKNIFSKSMLTDKELLILYGVIKGLKNYKNK